MSGSAIVYGISEGNTKKKRFIISVLLIEKSGNQNFAAKKEIMKIMPELWQSRLEKAVKKMRNKMDEKIKEKGAK
jgi:hypothetical protein